MTNINSNYTIPSSEFKYKSDAKYVWIQPVSEMYGFLTQQQVDSFIEDYDAVELVEALSNLNIGDSYDADGGINIYIRIR